MTRKLKCLALALASAMLFGVILTGCGGSGGGGSTPSAPSVPSVPSEPTTPTDPTSEVISVESTSQGQVDENGDYVLTKTYNVTVSDVELNSCVVVSDTIYWSEFSSVNRVVSTVAVWREALETENEWVNALENKIFTDTDKIVFVTIDYEYDVIGTIARMTLRYKDYVLEFEAVGGELQGTENLSEAIPILETVFNEAIKDDEIGIVIIRKAENVYNNAETLVNTHGYIIESGDVYAKDGSWGMNYTKNENGIRIAKTYFSAREDAAWTPYVDSMECDAEGESIIRILLWSDGSGSITFTYDTNGKWTGVMVGVGNIFKSYEVENGRLQNDFLNGDVSLFWKGMLGNENPSEDEIYSFACEMEKDARQSYDECMRIIEEIEGMV